MEILIESYKMDESSVKCSNVSEGKNNAKKCTLKIRDTKIDYYLKDKEGHTMYPIKIIGKISIYFYAI